MAGCCMHSGTEQHESADFCRENDHLLQDLLLTFQRYAELSGV